MVLVVILLSVIVLVLVLLEISCRLQMKSISRQLAFLRRHETNKIVTGNYGDHRMTELIDEINAFILLSTQTKKESVNKQKQVKETITILSHDIRTPLTSLDGYFQLLSKAENLSEREKYMDIIDHRIQNLKELLDELFTYAKLQNDAYEIPLEKCCINKILLDTVLGFYQEFKSAGIEPDVDACNESLYIMGNVSALTRIVQNLVKNTLEHGNRAVHIKLSRCGEQAKIMFSNPFKNKPQINESRVFDLFYKADNARSRNTAGLGLSISKELVTRMNGQIEAKIENETFSIFIRFQILK